MIGLGRPRFIAAVCALALLIGACAPAQPAAPSSTMSEKPAAAPTSAPAAPPAAQPAAPAASPAAAAASPAAQAAPSPAAQAAPSPAAAGAAAAKPAPAAQMRKLTIALSGWNSLFWPLMIAQDQGFLAERGVEADVILTGSAAAAIQAQIAGSAPLAFVGGDTAANAIEKGADLTIVSGAVNQALYFLVVQPEIKSFDQLRGKTFGVASIRGGGATVFLRRMLEKNGLKNEGTDYNFVTTGTVPERYSAMKAKGVAGIVVVEPEVTRLSSEGFNVLAKAMDYVGDYQSAVISAQKKWAKENEALLVDYLRGYIKALNFLYDPKNKDRAIDILAERTKAERVLAEGTYRLHIVENQGYPKAGEVNMLGLEHAIQMMIDIGDMNGPAPQPDKFIDASYLEKAKRQ